VVTIQRKDAAALDRAKREPLTPVGGRIKAARARSGLTQQQLAGERYTKAYISALENGLVRPSVAALEYLAPRLGTTPAELMDDARPRWSRLEADLLLAAGKFQAASDAYEAILDDQRAAAGDAGLRAELLCSQAETLVRLERNAEAAAVASEAVELFESVGREADAALASYWLSAAVYGQENLVEAKAILQAVLGRVRAGLRVAPDFKLRLLMALASNESRDGNHQAALAYLEEIRELADTLDDRRRATYLLDLAIGYSGTGDYEAGIRAGYASLALFAAVERESDMGRLENELAMAHLHTGNLSRADELASNAERRFADLGDDRLRAHVIDTRAQIALARGNSQTAIELAEQSLEMGRAAANDLAIIDAQLTLGRAYASIEPPTDELDARATAAFDAAAELSRVGQRPGTLRRVLTEWADFCAARGDHERAFALTREALATQR
jgi:transcriptional regulator with XRE-family HTH domain